MYKRSKFYPWKGYVEVHNDPRTNQLGHRVMTFRGMLGVVTPDNFQTTAPHYFIEEEIKESALHTQEPEPDGDTSVNELFRSLVFPEMACPSEVLVLYKASGRAHSGGVPVLPSSPSPSSLCPSIVLVL